VKQHLVFPTPTATAFTIRSLHSTTSAAARIAAKQKVFVLSGSFGLSFLFKSLCGYAPGLLQDWHIFYWLYTWGWKGAIAGEAWGWMIELTPAFWGAGMLSGLNASWSFMAGTILAWGILGPISIARGWTISKPNDYGVDDPLWRNYFSMTATDFVNSASPRYWMLWPGIMAMLCYVSCLACHCPVVADETALLVLRRALRQLPHHLQVIQATCMLPCVHLPLLVCPPQGLESIR
jgi:OPT oligopeptide transporter protein